MSLPTITRQYHFPKLGSYLDLELKEKPVNRPKPHEVLVKVHAVSLQYRDLLVAQGVYAAKDIPDQLVPCSDMAGEVIALGEGVLDFKVGDRVCANFSTDHLYGDPTPAIIKSSLGGQSHGVLTQYRTFPAHVRDDFRMTKRLISVDHYVQSLVKFPEHFSYEEASTLPCAALTAYNALNGPVPIKAGDTVLILGTGGVSIFGLQFAVAAGATVIATSSSDEKLQNAADLGATHLINYKKYPDWDEEVLKITNGVGVDHILEVGGFGTLPRSLNAVRVAGHLHIIGAVSEVTPKDKSDFNPITPTIYRAITLRGLVVGSVAQFKDMNRLILANPTKTRPVISKVFSLEEAREAYAYLESQKHVGKVVIKVA